MINREIENINDKGSDKCTLFNVFGNVKSPFFIAEPCAVENFEMIDEVTSYLVHKCINVIRVGAFKPRTKYYDFQGLGEEGLKILKEIRKRL